jgi:hypothetical protein
MLRTIVSLTMIFVLVVFTRTGSAQNCYRLVSGGTCDNHGEPPQSSPCANCHETTHECQIRVYMMSASQEDWDKPRGAWQEILDPSPENSGYTDKEDGTFDCVKFGTCKLPCIEVDNPETEDPFDTKYVCDMNDPNSTLSINDDKLKGVPCPEEE